jgi:hypothetical protein
MGTKKILIIGTIIFIILILSFFIFIKVSYNSNPALEEKLESFFVALANDDYKAVEGLIDEDRIYKDNVRDQIKFWKDIYGVKSKDDISIKLKGCRMGQLIYNKLGEVYKIPPGKLVRCSNTKIYLVSPFGGGYVDEFNLEFEINGLKKYIGYSDDLHLSPPYINLNEVGLEKIESIPREFEGIKGIAEYNLSSKTDYKMDNIGQIRIELESLNVRECDKLPIVDSKLKQVNPRSECFIVLAYVLGDVDLCKKSNGFNLCVSEYARKRQSLKACNLLYDNEVDDMKKSEPIFLHYSVCAQNVIYSDLSLRNCELLKKAHLNYTLYDDYCYDSFAQRTNDISICNFIESDEVKNECLESALPKEEIIRKNLEISSMQKNVHT